jgi:putative flippase GtrA
MAGVAASSVPSSEEAVGDRLWPLRYSLAWVAGAAPALAVVTALWLYPSDFHGIGEIALGAFALMFPVMVRQIGVRRNVRFVYFLLGAGLAFAVISILTGAGNGLTDEPYTTPRYVDLLWAHRDPYVVPLVFTYQQYGQTLHSASVYLYLPLLMFFQVPGLDYKWFAVGCWVLLVVLVRKRFHIAVALGQPYFAIVAASGYNDLVVLVFLTLAFVGLEGRRQRWAEIVSLGLKQFANAIVLAYYIFRRDWKNTVVTAAVSAAFIAPFFLWSGPAVICPAVFADRLPGCTTGGAPSYLLNYSTWVVWTVAVFYQPLVGELRRSADHGWTARLLQRSRMTFDELLRLPSYVVVGVSGVFVNLCMFTFLGHYLGHATVPLLVASAGAFGVATVWNFTWNRAWAFEGRGERALSYHLAVYGLIQLGALGLNLVILDGGVSVGVSPLTAQILGIVVGSVVGFVANLRWNFRAPATATTG